MMGIPTHMSTIQFAFIMDQAAARYPMAKGIFFQKKAAALNDPTTLRGVHHLASEAEVEIAINKAVQFAKGINLLTGPGDLNLEG